MRLRSSKPPRARASASRPDCRRRVRLGSVRERDVRPLNPYPRNDHLAIEMNINGRVVFADAAVLHSHQPGKEPFTEPGMGLKFIRIAPEDRDFLRQFIREEDSRGIVPENE